MLYPKKSLGQNFLRSKSALMKIIEAADLKPDDVVLEVGPGEGILTSALLEKAGKVIAVEKDDRLIPFLRQKFSREIEIGKLTLIHEDILEFSIFNFQFSNYKLIANIPYYITGALLKNFLQSDSQPSKMVLLLQKEVAKRIVQSAKGRLKESILSISVKVYGEPRYVDTVKAECFSPQPKVDSAILSIENISKKFFTENNLNEENFFSLVKTGFKSKRKILIGNLGISKHPELEKILAEAGITRKTRAEEISVSQWAKLAKALS